MRWAIDFAAEKEHKEARDAVAGLAGIGGQSSAENIYESEGVFT